MTEVFGLNYIFPHRSPVTVTTLLPMEDCSFYRESTSFAETLPRFSGTLCELLEILP